MEDLFKNREQQSRERHIRDLKQLQENEYFQKELFDIRELIKNKSPQETINFLEFYVVKENPEIREDFIYFLIHDTTLYSSRKISDIEKDIQDAGGIFPYFEIIKNKLKNRWPLAGWIIDCYGLLLNESAKLYSRALFEIKQVNTATGEKDKALKEKKPFVIQINWLSNDEKPDYILIKLKGVLLNYENLQAIIDGKKTLSLIGENKHVDALVFFYVLSKANKIKIESTCFKQVANTFNLDRKTVSSCNTKMFNPIRSKGIMIDETLHEQFGKRVEEIEKILKF